MTSASFCSTQFSENTGFTLVVCVLLLFDLKRTISDGCVFTLRPSHTLCVLGAGFWT